MKENIEILQAAAELKLVGKYSEAETLLKDLIQANTSFAPAYNSLGSLYFIQQKWKEAEQAFREAIECQADYTEAYYNLALALSRLYRDREALTVYQALLELIPEHLGAQFQSGCLLMRQSQFQQAYQMFNKLLKSHPLHVESLINLAACCVKLNRIEEAKTYYIRALESTPNDAQVLYNLGVICMNQGLIDEAIDYYQQAITMAPVNYEAQNNIGVAYLAKNEREKALLHFREALRLQPENISLQHTVAVLSHTSQATDSPPDYIRVLFDSYAPRYDIHVQQSLHYAVPALFKAILEPVLKDKKELTILDLGCGTGLCGEIVKSWAASLVGVDLSPRMLEIAKEKHCYTELVEASTLSFLSGESSDAVSVDTMPAKSAMSAKSVMSAKRVMPAKAGISLYDLILAGDVLVYTGDLAETFTLIHHALKPNGLFIFNIEAGEKAPYALSTSGRFAHTKSYVDSLIKQKHFELLQFEEAALREQEGKEVKGYIYLLKAISRAS